MNEDEYLSIPCEIKDGQIMVQSFELTSVTPVCNEMCLNHYGPTDLTCTLDRGHKENHRHHLCDWPINPEIT